MQKLKISFIQSNIYWENKEKNLNYFEKQIKKTNSDIVLLPEMFSTGFSMNAKKLSETMKGKTVNWMKELANFKKAVIAGSIIIEENKKFFNRFLWVNPNGEIIFYNKRHLFSMAEENLHYTKGNERIIINYNGWKFCPIICYDLRFPVWCRNKNDYDVLICVANWPEIRIQAWNTLLQARAIENYCYTIGVNRIGIDGKNIKYNGSSAVYDFKGNTIFNAKNKEVLAEFFLYKKNLSEYKNKFPVYKDSDDFIIN